MACKCQKMSFNPDKDSRSHLILSEHMEKKQAVFRFPVLPKPYKCTLRNKGHTMKQEPCLTIPPL